ncbi:hypothetical protein BLX87_12445 [Bacillus sp. VT-16-64]|nr:hypothetical protein BLX87_12445 [Bacillus sp. VT-16-64]
MGKIPRYHHYQICARKVQSSTMSFIEKRKGAWDPTKSTDKKTNNRVKLHSVGVFFHLLLDVS